MREAARQLRIPPSTLSHWLEGGARAGRSYPPVLREVPTGSAEVTWGEMVQAYVDANRRLMIELQKSSGRPEELWLVYEPRSRQYVVDAHLRRDFLDQVEFEEGGVQAATWLRPAGRHSPVVMDPRISSSASTVAGIRTEILAEQARAGAPLDEIAEDFGLNLDQLRAAIAYEFTPAAWTWGSVSLGGTSMPTP